ncbi:T4 family baseplate hub assembly chaperone [Niabella ginsenosidivorans]|uniref:T4 family baseplate hub assembly chaperone n=1 Tax=Niabella ginsenosidivorans TaxID=1176587 RepID=UPI0012EEC632|nr:hypothetical protein [Niabella ginsenosidivorans]
MWETCLPLSPVRRSRLLLTVAFPNDDIGGLSVGQCNGRLLRLRQQLFGNRLPSLARCPACSQTAEWEQDLLNFQLETVLGNKTAEQRDITLDEYTVHFRLPGIADMEVLETIIAAGEKQQHLLKQCVLNAYKKEEVCPVNELPQTVIQEMEAQMAATDPLADIRVLLSCPACSNSWEAVFDIQSYLWKELNAWARSLFKEIYTLAKYFGWGETEILEMSHQRRRLYLKMIWG